MSVRFWPKAVIQQVYKNSAILVLRKGNYMDTHESLDALAFDFFREFARCEYCLKAVGLRVPNKEYPIADWGALAEEVQDVFNTPPSDQVDEAIKYYLTWPPKKQVLKDDLLDWKDVKPDHKSLAELVLRLVCRVRNNLFHGGKFNGHWFEPQRSDELLRHGLSILRTVVEAHPKVKQAYAQRDV